MRPVVDADIPARLFLQTPQGWRIAVSTVFPVLSGVPHPLVPGESHPDGWHRHTSPPRVRSPTGSTRLTFAVTGITPG
jgi:hypothetical protein